MLTRAAHVEPVRGNDRHDAVDVGREGPDRDECVHVRSAVPGRGPGAREKFPPGPEENRGGEHELDPRPSGKVEHRRKRRDEVPRHSDNGDGNSEDGGDEELEPRSLEVCLPGRLLGVRHTAAVVARSRKYCVVPGPTHDVPESVRGGRSRVVLDSRPAGGEVDGGL